MMTSKTAREIFLDANKRAGEAAFLREVGLTYQQIGDRMGVSRSRAKTLSDKGAKIRAKRKHNIDPKTSVTTDESHRTPVEN